MRSTTDGRGAFWYRAAGFAALGTLVATAPLAAASLRGTTASLDLQNRQARQNHLSFIGKPSQVRAYVEQGLLVEVEGDDDFFLKEVSFPYARPAVRDFILELAPAYRRECKEQLVVTSLTRPRSTQPRNASPRSVHPTGMALDLRRSWSRSCRGWIEQTLLALEERGVLEATYETRPPHYHIAVFPARYRAAAGTLLEQAANRYYVRPGDTLWKIATRHRTTVSAVVRANGLRSNRIFPGQVLRLPAGSQ